MPGVGGGSIEAAATLPARGDCGITAYTNLLKAAL
jgi:hypothetical protein